MWPLEPIVAILEEVCDFTRCAAMWFVSCCGCIVFELTTQHIHVNLLCLESSFWMHDGMTVLEMQNFKQADIKTAD